MTTRREDAIERLVDEAEYVVTILDDCDQFGHAADLRDAINAYVAVRDELPPVPSYLAALDDRLAERRVEYEAALAKAEAVWARAKVAGPGCVGESFDPDDEDEVCHDDQG